MKTPTQTRSIYASIQDIITTQDRKKLRKGEVNKLFVCPNLSQIDTSQFNRHPFMFKNQLFTFFVHQLQKWNKKIRSKEITPFYHSELKKYNFIHSSLKIISLRKANQINQYLQQLSLWYSKNSYNIPQPSVLMKKYDSTQEWEIRKTFKSNTSSEINNFRRRFFCSAEDKEQCLETLGISTKKQDNFLNNQKSNKLNSSLSNGFLQATNVQKFRRSQTAQQPFKEIDQNSQKFTLNKRNIEIRRNREQKQIKQAQNQWKVSHSRFGQKSCQNFYQGKFKTNKYYSPSTTRLEPRKINTAAYNMRNSQQLQLVNSIKKRRLQTTMGFRKSYANEPQIPKNQEQLNPSDKIIKQETQKQCTKNWIDNLIVDQNRLTIRNTFDRSGSSISLMVNPFEAVKSKIKRKKK